MCHDTKFKVSYHDNYIKNVSIYCCIKMAITGENDLLYVFYMHAFTKSIGYSIIGNHYSSR